VNPSIQQITSLLASIDAQLSSPSQTFGGLEFHPWIQPGNVGNDLGSSSKPHGNYSLTPGWSILQTRGAAPYDNFYLYRDLGPQNYSNHFAYSFDLMFPTDADLKACQAFEFEIQANVGGRIYNGAWQIDFADSKKWRYFNYSTSQWLSSGIDVDFRLFGPEKAVSIAATFQRNKDLTMTHQRLAINGTEHAVNVTLPSFPKVESDYLHCALQTDSNASFTPYQVGIRNIQVACSRVE